jgi:hypothetical protein
MHESLPKRQRETLSSPTFFSPCYTRAKELRRQGANRFDLVCFHYRRSNPIQAAKITINKPGIT